MIRSRPGFVPCLVVAVAFSHAGCGSGSSVAVPEIPPRDALGLSAEESKSFSPIEFDKLVTALEVAGDDANAVETVILRVNRKTVAWAGIVKRHRLVKNGPEKSEFSLSVAPPGQAGKMVPTTLPVLFEVANDDPIATIESGEPLVFVGRLEFDGLTREPWVLDSRRIEVSTAP
jgi:hypothetical protein